MLYGRFASFYDMLYRAQGKDYEREACRLHRLGLFSPEAYRETLARCGFQVEYVEDGLSSGRGVYVGVL